MRLIGIQAIYPKKKTTIFNKKEYKYPYLLNDIKIIRTNQVWSTDITYIKGILRLIVSFRLFFEISKIRNWIFL